MKTPRFAYETFTNALPAKEQQTFCKYTIHNTIIQMF